MVTRFYFDKMLPLGSMSFPRTEARPAKLGLAINVMADHMIAAAVFLDLCLAIRTILDQEIQRRRRDVAIIIFN